MGQPGLGIQSYVGWAPETTWGTPAARTKFGELVSESLQLRTNPTFPQSFRGLSKRRVYEGKRFVEGDVTLELHYAGFEQLFKQLFHTVSPTTGPTAVTVYTHTFIPAIALLPGLSIEVERDVQAFLYEGCKINQAKFAMEIDKMLTVTLSCVGDDETQVAASTPTYPAEAPILYTQAVVKLDTTAFDCVAFEFTINNNLFSDRRKLGSKLIKELSRNGQMQVSGTVKIEFEDVTLYNKYVNRTDVKLNLILTGSAISGSSASTNESLDFEFPRCVITGQTPVVGGPGPISVQMQFEAMYNVTGGAEVCKATLINGTTTIT